jgi:hypothetical protein
MAISPRLSAMTLVPFVIIMAMEVVQLDTSSAFGHSTALLMVCSVLVVNARPFIVHLFWKPAKHFVAAPSFLSTNIIAITQTNSHRLGQELLQMEASLSILVIRKSMGMALFRLYSAIIIFFQLYLHSMEKIQQGRTRFVSTDMTRFVGWQAGLRMCESKTASWGSSRKPPNPVTGPFLMYTFFDRVTRLREMMSEAG